MIIHAVPSFIALSEYGAGNWKAVEATRLALEDTGLPFQRVTFDEHNSLELLDHVSDTTRDVVIEYSMFPDVLRDLRRRAPAIGLHVRTHNAEPFQHVSRAVSGRSWRDHVRRSVWRRSAALLVNDVRCRRHADTLLGISDWDDRHYWRWLPGGARVRAFPYFCVWPYHRPHVKPEPWDLRRWAIVSMGGNFDPSGLANVENFQALAQRVGRLPESKWSFELTWWDQWHDRVPDVKAPVEVLREVVEPWDLLCHVKVLAVLTPIGYGLKTTVIDGLAAGCHVIVHPRLAKRLPNEVAKVCLVFDPKADDPAALVEALPSPPDRNHLNDRLRNAAANILRASLRS
jgi:hypothetical protein